MGVYWVFYGIFFVTQISIVAFGRNTCTSKSVKTNLSFGNIGGKNKKETQMSGTIKSRRILRVA